MLKTLVRKSFLEHFHHDIKDHFLIEKKCRLNLHILKITNNQFEISPLLRELSNSILTFCLSKKEYQQYIDEQRFGELNLIAQERFRDYQSNDGEFGELLLYCLLESHLGAPKILTKMNLKTSHNDYVKGADGVHLLKLNDDEYQIVFGESKMYKNVRAGLKNAFESINSFLTHSKNNVDYEMQILNAHFHQEVLEENAYEEIKKIILPSAQEDEIQTDKAFGIFVGFNLEVDKDLKKRLSNKEFNIEIRKRVSEIVQKEFSYIESLIDKYDLYGYNFYIYCIPFSEMSETRKAVIKKLKGE